ISTAFLQKFDKLADVSNEMRARRNLEDRKKICIVMNTESTE
ncbi:36045_t:CDS:1, partial [Gigaspora margarita]